MISNYVKPNWEGMVKDLKTGDSYVIQSYPQICGINGYVAWKVPKKASKTIEVSTGNMADLYIIG